MKFWRCPQCKRVRVFREHLVFKICPVCQIDMELNEVKENGKDN